MIELCPDIHVGVNIIILYYSKIFHRDQFNHPLNKSLCVPIGQGG